MVGIVNDSNFNSKVSTSSGYVLVDFWAEWCGPCRRLLPIMEEMHEELGGKLQIVKVNIDDSPESASAMSIRSVPTLILFKDGQKVDLKVGSLSKIALISWLKLHIPGL
ncbi:Thioredoxin [Candidatus Cyrtobacter comes]|uniref:Thioredoxin n=1 Tax=Candidatus Cyrtobacter comes TaxID=675776 RepID=A0ABU5L7L5_9RICK|nr:thioredoxin [Candidatus Cyrtobacter comes]MDZ5761799.1 Thioredoxin [Candidatus Cyrtobacter comes]